jgi:hypothetical protein
MSRIETGSAMRLTEISSGISRPVGGKPEAPHEPAESRALVALTPGASVQPANRGRHTAEFLAHLIATKNQLPQTRERRRADASEAIAAYQAASLRNQ